MTDVATRLDRALSLRYRIEREIGAGGMATVYLAHDLRHQRRVALKVLRPDLVAILGTERFLHEIQVTANLARSDVYSPGSVVYEKLAGDPPHTGAAVQVTARSSVWERAGAARARGPGRARRGAARGRTRGRGRP